MSSYITEVVRHGQHKPSYCSKCVEVFSDLPAHVRRKHPNNPELTKEGEEKMKKWFYNRMDELKVKPSQTAEVLEEEDMEEPCGSRSFKSQRRATGYKTPLPLDTEKTLQLAHMLDQNGK